MKDSDFRGFLLLSVEVSYFFIFTDFAVHHAE
jgi:hypothetical protein